MWEVYNPDAEAIARVWVERRLAELLDPDDVNRILDELRWVDGDDFARVLLSALFPEAK